MRFLFVSLACVLSASAFGELSLSGRLPEDLIPELRRVVEKALEHSHVVAERGLIESEAEGRRIAARAARKPSFRTSVAFRQEKDEDTLGESQFEERVVYNVVLSQPLYYWGALKSEKENGEILYDIESLRSQQAKINLVQSIRSEYMALVVAKQRLKRTELDLEDEKEKLEYQLESIRKGQASGNSAFPLELEVERQEIAVLKGRSDWDYRLDELASNVGMSVAELESLVVDEIPAFELLSSEEVNAFAAFFDLGVESDVTNQSLALDLEVEKRRLNIVDQSLKPRIDAQLGLSSNALDLDGTRREQSYSYFGLSVAWNIFDGFRKKGRSMEALNRLTRKERSKELFEADLVRKFERLLATVEIEMRSLAIEERALESLQGNVEYISERVEQGLASETQLEQRERDLTNTSIKTQSFRINYLNALSKLATELGLDSSVVK